MLKVKKDIIQIRMNRCFPRKTPDELFLSSLTFLDRTVSGRLSYMSLSAARTFHRLKVHEFPYLTVVLFFVLSIVKLIFVDSLESLIVYASWYHSQLLD
jgi:hypothetical protein